MSWLITGGGGFIGCNLTDELLSNGEEVVVFDNFSRLGSASNLEWLRKRHGTEFRVVEGDTRSAESLLRIVAEVKPDAIAHLAGQVAATTSIENPRMDFEVNALGALNVLEAVRIKHPSAVVMFSSTNKVYGSLEELTYAENATRYEAVGYERGFDESLPLNGSTPYGCSKLTADSYFRDYYRVFGIRTVVFRHSSMYGGRQFPTIDQGWIGWFCMKALEMLRDASLEISIAGNGKQVRDLLYASDLVSCYLQAFQAADHCSGQAFNIGGGMANSLSLIELFRVLSSLIGKDFTFRTGPWRVADQKIFVASTYKASQSFGWNPSVSYQDGIARMMEWSRSVLDSRREAVI